MPAATIRQHRNSKGWAVLSMPDVFSKCFMLIGTGGSQEFFTDLTVANNAFEEKCVNFGCEFFSKSTGVGLPVNFHLMCPESGLVPELNFDLPEALENNEFGSW